MLRIRLRSARIPLAPIAATIMVALAPMAGGVPAGAALRASLVLPTQSGCEVAGPFATMRRANEVAAEARHRGYRAVAYHDGDGYYVRAC